MSLSFMEFLSLSLLVIFSSSSPLLSHKNSINKPPNFTSTQTHINPSLFSAFVEKSKANLTLEPTITDLIWVLYDMVWIFTFFLMAAATKASSWVLGWFGFFKRVFYWVIVTMVTVAILYMYSVIDPLMWVVFFGWKKCINLTFFYILQ